MTTRHLDKMFAPRSVALIGASTRAGSVGALVAQNLLSAGFEGPIHFVNPKGGEIEGRALGYEWAWADGTSRILPKS